jgi:hypothetical protein
METRTVREVERERVVAAKPRGWGRRVDPLRRTADGFGAVLDKLSDSVTGAFPRYGGVGGGFADGDSADVDFDVEAGRRTRGFKLRQFQSDADAYESGAAAPFLPDIPAAPPELTQAASTQPASAASASAPPMPAAVTAAATEQAAAEVLSEPVSAEEAVEVLDMLKEARDVAAEAMAPVVVMPAHDRAAAQERLKELFFELSMKRIEILSTIFSGPDEVAGAGSIFSLSTPGSAKAAYEGIDAMLMKYLNAGRDTEALRSADSVYTGHEAAMSATEQLKEFLKNESPEKAFARFREVNRSNILGLLS